MTRSAAIAEKVRLTTKTQTDYATAKALGISQSNLKQVLDGRRGLGTESCVRAADILRASLDHLLAEVEAERARTPEKKAFWEQRLPRILPALATWGLAAGVNYISYCWLTTSEVVRHAIHYA
jgi:predicted transcriptional regulator